MEARFDGTILFGPDPSRLAAFYVDALGFTREPTDGSDVPLRVGTSDGNGSIGLLVHPGESRGVHLGTFSVRELDRAVEHVRQHGAKVLSPPEDTPWGTREATIEDPDGNGLILTESPA